MSSAPNMSSSSGSDGRCGSIARLLGAHADGQLDPAKTLEVDDHLGSCETCRERTALDQAIRGSLKKAVKTTAPSDVRARMLAAMTGENGREDARIAAAAPLSMSDTVRQDLDGTLAGRPPGSPSGNARPSMLRHWRTMIPLAGAAAITLAWGFASHQPVAASDAAVARAGFGNDDFVNQLVDVHSHPIHPETADPKMVRGFEREVGVPVRVGMLAQNAHFVGGRLLPMQGGERTAMLQYEVSQPNGGVERVSVFIYDRRRVQIRDSDFASRAVGTAQVRAGQAHGYSFAVAQHGDVGYAVASDMDVDQSAQLVGLAANVE